MSTLPLCLLLVVGWSTAEHTTTPRSYIINLDLKPELRWNDVITDFRLGKYGAPFNFNQFIDSLLDMYVPKRLRNLTQAVAADLDNILPLEYAREIKGIARAARLPLGNAIIATLLYDVSAFCTSVVVQNDRNEIYHGRNLDYDFSTILRNITFNAHFTKNGTTVYSAVTYAGIAGIFTGQKPRVFTLSINQRNKGFWWENAAEIIESLLTGHVNLVSLIARKALEESASFDEAVKHISRTDTWAPAYFIVAGVRSGEGVLITKNRILPPDLYYLKPSSEDRWFLLETNYDRWQTPPPEDDRRDPGVEHIKRLGRSGFNATSMFDVLSTPPVLSPTTTYTAIMSAAKPEVFRSWIQYP